MALQGLDLCLSITTVVVVLADIILALCLRFVLPKHITHKGYYPADGRVLAYQEALDVCPCLARVFPDGTKDPIKFIKVEDKMSRRRRRQIEGSVEASTMGNYPFLVSLSIPAYIDDLQQKIFACNGFVQTSRTLVTTKSCVKNESEWRYITVRSNSPYWSKLGQVHGVINVSYIDYDLVMLKVYPDFAESVIPKPPINYPYGGRWIYSFTAGWDDKMYEKKSKFRYKYKKFDVEEWTTQNCSLENTKNVCFGEKQCTKTSSKFLFSSCHQLLGLKFDGGNKCDQFSGVGVKIPENFSNSNGCYNIYQGTCNTAESEVCY